MNEKKLILEACGNKETAIQVDNNTDIASTQIYKFPSDIGGSDTDNIKCFPTHFNTSYSS